MADISSTDSRKKIIDEILGEENQKRKNESFKRAEVYSDRAEPYVMKGLNAEFDSDTVKEMRKILSINLTKRIIDEKASLYRKCPDRQFQTTAGKELSEQEQKQIDNLYAIGKFDWKFKKGDKSFELQDQCAIQVVPKNGIIDMRVLQPHQFDVIPDDMDPESAGVYIISVHDRSKVISGSGGNNNNFEVSNPPKYQSSGQTSFSDGVNQKIGDSDDYKRKLMRFVWWSTSLNMLTDGNGQVLDPATEQVVVAPDESLIKNELGALPFVDVAILKENEFWVRCGSGVVQFDLEFAMLLMDTFYIHKMQGFSQAIIYAEKPPVNMKVGPNHVMHIPLDPNKEVQPRFEFASPNSDLSASMELIETFLRLFLTSNGVDPKTVSGTADGQKFSSGIERLLSMIDKFEASRDTIDLFKWVEQQVLKLVIKWSNLFQGVTTANGFTQPLIPELRLATLPEDIVVNVNFAPPEVIQTKGEKEDSVIKLMENGLMSRVQAIMEVNDVTEEEAKRLLSEIDASGLPGMGNVNGQGSEAQISN